MKKLVLIICLCTINTFANISDNQFLSYIVDPIHAEGDVYHEQDEIMVIEFFIQQKKVGLVISDSIEYTFEGDDRNFGDVVTPLGNRVTIFINIPKQTYSYKISPSTRLAPNFDIAQPSEENKININFKNENSFDLEVMAVNSALLFGIGPSIDAYFQFFKEEDSWSGNYIRDGFPNIEIGVWKDGQRESLVELEALTDDPMVGLSIVNESGEF